MILLATAQAGAGELTKNTPRSPYRLDLERAEAYRLRPAGLDSVSSRAHRQLAGKPYASQIHHAAREAALDPALVHAVIAIESGYDAGARSPKGALGLMQVMPQTALRYGVRDPMRSTETNLGVGTRYLSDLIAMFDGRLDLALAAYNAGEQAVLRHGERIPPYGETQRYVKAVSQKYRALLRGAVLAPAASLSENVRDTRLNADVRRDPSRVARARR